MEKDTMPQYNMRVRSPPLLGDKSPWRLQLGRGIPAHARKTRRCLKSNLCTGHGRESRTRGTRTKRALRLDRGFLREVYCMTASKALSLSREISREICVLERVREAAFNQVTRITAAIGADRVDHSSDPHPFDTLAILDDEIYTRLRTLTEIRADALRMINSLDDPRQREVLIAYYVGSNDGRPKTWSQVSAELYISQRQIQRVHASALAALDNMDLGS